MIERVAFLADVSESVKTNNSWSGRWEALQSIFHPNLPMIFRCNRNVEGRSSLFHEP